jgi:predicted GNAT family N-acyltransferase
MSLQIHIIEADWEQHKANLQSIREVVFIKEQEVPQDIEWDGQDEYSTHFLAVNELGQYIGCARLMPSGQIGRMAVLEEYRGTGVGAELLQFVVESGKATGFDRLFLHAQSYAINFYKKGGFIAFGGEFEEAGIAHMSMEMKLPLAFPQDTETSDTHPNIREQEVRPTLTKDESQVKPFGGFSECTEALHEVIASARRRLLILSPYLDHELFDKEGVEALVSALARSAPKVEIHILIFNSKLIVNRGHLLVDLARRLDGKIKIRLLQEQPTSQSSSFVCADLDAYWLLPSSDKHDGVCDLANPVTCRRLTEAFESAWSKSSEDPELRRLRL